MAPEQRNLFEQLGRKDTDVYARLFRCVVKRVPPDEEFDGERLGSAGAADRWQRKALLLHLGDVLESISCLTKCGEHYHTVGEAAAQEESLATFPLLRQVDPEMTPVEFVKAATSAFFLWPMQLLEPELNRKAIGHLVQHDLFAGNRAGWDAYVEEMRHVVPWFGAGLEDYMPEPFDQPGDGVNLAPAERSTTRRRT
jgi:hypothetical protein